MMRRDLDVPDSSLCESALAQRAVQEFTLISRPNWTAIIFLCALAFLHFSIAIPAFLKGRWEGYMSAGLACIFTTAAILTHKVRSEIRFQPRARRIQVHNGIGRLAYARSIPFADVHAVRLTLPSTRDASDARIEVLCDNEDIDCPPTTIPRQEALYLAIMLNVQLIKVESEARPNRAISV